MSPLKNLCSKTSIPPFISESFPELPHPHYFSRAYVSSLSTGVCIADMPFVHDQTENILIDYFIDHLKAITRIVNFTVSFLNCKA